MSKVKLLYQLTHQEYFSKTKHEKDVIQLIVMHRYLEEAQHEIEEALSLIEYDIPIFERLEYFEYCQLLKDIVKRFE